MSDADKPTPESPPSGTSEASGGSGANVISIEQARAELLRKPRARATPPQGIRDKPRSRGREVPTPVTMPPGEHSAVIVTDTPAARAHVDKKTVHPGEAPEQTHDKKVRVKTSLDPRRAKTQVTDRRSSTPAPGAAGEGDVGSLWSNPAGSVPPGPITSSQPPPGVSPSQRPSLARPRPLPRESRGAPLFLIGVALAAALGAVVVFLISRPKPAPGPSGTNIQLTAMLPVPCATATGETAPATSASTSGATGTAEPSNTGAPVPSELPSAVTATPLKTGHSPSVKPSASPSAPPTASAKPTATSILPFGKEEP